MKRLILIAALAALPTLAQEAPKPETKLIRLKNVPSGRVFNLLAGLPGKVYMDGDIIVLTGTPESVAMREELIRQIDAPPPAKRNIEINTYMLLGVNDPGDAKAPPELAGVVKQLKEAFSFPGYRLIETMYMRATEDRGGETSGMMPGPGGAGDPGPKAIYQCKFNVIKVEETGAARRIVFHGLKFGTKIPYPTGKDGFQYADLGANIDTVSVREGQKAVIGKAAAGPGKESLFLVLSAKVVE